MDIIVLISYLDRFQIHSYVRGRMMRACLHICTKTSGYYKTGCPPPPHAHTHANFVGSKNGLQILSCITYGCRVLNFSYSKFLMFTFLLCVYMTNFFFGLCRGYFSRGDFSWEDGGTLTIKSFKSSLNLKCYTKNRFQSFIANRKFEFWVF